MKYSIENKGTGVVMIRVFVPEQMASVFLDFINQKDKELTRKDPALLKQLSHLNDENYFMQKTQAALTAFQDCQTAGIDNKTSIAEVTKKMKVLGFGNISYEQVRLILTQNGCFRSK